MTEITFCHLLKPQCLNNLDEWFEFQYIPIDNNIMLLLLLYLTSMCLEFFSSISIKSPTSATVLTTANQNDVSNRQRKQQQYQQNQKTVKTSRSHSINVRIPKCVKQPAFEASQDKINIAKRKFNTNNQKFDVIAATANNITTSIQCCPLNNRTVVDSANRTASGLM